MSRDSEISKKLYPGKTYSELSSQQKQQVERTIKEAQAKKSAAPTSNSKKKTIYYDPSKTGQVRSQDTGLLIPKDVAAAKPKTIVLGVERTKSGLIQSQTNLSSNMGRGQSRQLANAIQRYNKEVRNAQQAYQIALAAQREEMRKQNIRGAAISAGPGGQQVQALQDALRITRQLQQKIPYNQKTINTIRELLLQTRKGTISKITTLSDKTGFVFEKSNGKISTFQNGVIRAATPKERRKLLFEKNLDREKNIELSSKAAIKGKMGEAIVRGTVVAGALGVVSGGRSYVNMFLKPKETISNLKTFARQVWNDPLEVVAAEGKRLVIDPVGVVAEYFTFSKLLGQTMKVARRSPVGRYVNEELFILNQPKKYRPYVRQIIKSAKMQEKLNPYKVKDIKKVDFLEVKALNKVEAEALKKALQKTDSVVFGSAASRALSRKKTPVPKDVDIAVNNGAKFGEAFIEALPKASRKNYLLQGSKLYKQVKSKSVASDPKGIMVLKGKFYDPIFDVKPLNRLYPDKALFRKKGFMPVTGYITKLRSKGIYKKIKVNGKTKRVKVGESVLPEVSTKLGFAKLEIPTRKVVTVEGIKMVGFGEQTVRKALGTLQALLEKNVRRAKDPQSFVSGLQVQIEGLVRSKPKTKFAKMRKNSRIKSLKKAYMVLTSKEFVKLLDEGIPTLSKEYPLVAKLPSKKLAKVKPLTKKQVDDIVSKTSSASLSGRESKKKVSSSKSRSKKKVVKKPVSVSSKELFKPKFIKETITKKKLGFEDYSLESQRFGRKIIDTQAKTEWALLEARFGSKINKYKKKWFADRKKDLFKEYFGNGKSKIITETRLRKIKNKVSSSLSSKLPSKKLYSYLPKSFLRSKLFSKPPSRTPSTTPSKAPSRLRSRTPSRTPSKAPSKMPSKVVSKMPSKAPSKVVSKTPSKVPSGTPSRLSGYVSRLPSRLRVLPPGNPPAVVKKVLRKKQVDKKDEQELNKYIKQSKRKYRPSLAAIIYDITGYSVPKSITGFEIRPIITAVKKARGKK